MKVATAGMRYNGDAEIQLICILIIAPEVFKSSGYGITVDWWSLGILFYECVYGKVISFYCFTMNDDVIVIS